MKRKDLPVNMLRRFLPYRQEQFSHVLKLILFSISNMLTNRDNGQSSLSEFFFEVIIFKIYSVSKVQYQGSKNLLLYG